MKLNKLVVGKTYRLTEDFCTFVKEGHEPGGISRALTLSEGNSFTVLKARENGHGWYEAQVHLTERYEPQYGGATIRWRGIILVNAASADKFEAKR
jgi:hypothetical protein